VYQALGDRMKQFYETRTETFLPRRIPAIIRVDGKAFHSFTRGMERPFSELLRTSMYFTAQELCKGIQGAILAYTQSDEISILLTDFQSIQSSAWFDYRVEKMVSVAASIATAAFNYAFQLNDYDNLYADKYWKALFDARVISLPKEEVNNYFIWRQLDAIRNAVQSVGQAHFSHAQLHGMDCDDIRIKLFEEKDINFDDLPTALRRGACIRKEHVTLNGVHGDYERGRWILDTEVPLFTENREYVWKGFRSSI
jgi:tRNA(His) guanylyltransferase